MKKGKRYVESAKLVDRTNLYDVEEAVSIIKKTANAKFDETIEAHIKLGVDGRHADQQVRGAVVLPHGTGKKVRVLVFAKGDKVEEAQAAGADFVGGQELVPKIQNEGWLDFDVVVDLVTQAVNEVENLRYTIRDNSVFLLDKRTPSFTELKKGSEQFQIITCPCEGTLADFCRAAKERSEAQTSFLEPSSKTDDLIYISCLPWFDLTCCTNERQVDIDDAIPRITWGKYIRQENGRETLGLSIEVNHRLVDGVHLGRFYESLQNKINELE